MTLIRPAHSIVNLTVSNRNWEVNFFESQFGRIRIKSELLKSIWEKRYSFPSFNFEKCRIYESFPESLDLDNLFSFPGWVDIDTSIDSYEGFMSTLVIILFYYSCLRRYMSKKTSLEIFFCNYEQFKVFRFFFIRR